LVGAGATGDTTGMAAAQCTTIMPSSRAAEPLIAADLITLTSAAGALATVTRSTVGAAVQGSAGLQRLTSSRGHAPVPSAALITAEMRADFPPEDNQALEAAPTGASMAVADDISGSYICVCGICREFKNGEEHHAAVECNFCST